MAKVNLLRPRQNATTYYGGELLDKDETALIAGQVSDVYITLYDVDTNTVINGRDGATDMISSVTISTADSVYNIEWTMSTADNPIVAASPPTGGEERHRLIIEGTLAGSGDTWIHEADIIVGVVNRPSTA